ncbi:type II secretion system F family protein [Chromobacterium haemolyticum]|uniref:type II secretion system F family protein n=1 Tax=Chromobacterium haemolyticum TaxID=394935 RepID=UPI00244A1204|nr:type II secretion system F family protein [Chromobacterium haemolyticum]MDH0341962.1 type II secretion system F family protein [Chromobacterium haemolyticum]
MRSESFMEWIDDARVRARFGSAARIEFYEAMSLLMENHVLLNDALKEMYKVASEDGKKPNNPRAIVIYDCMMGVGEGKPLSKVLEKWTNYQETSLIAAGEKSSNLTKAFADAVKIITAKQQIASAVAMATAYPIVLFGMTCMLLNMVATQLVPKLSKIVNPETWEGSAALLYQMAKYVTDYGQISLIAVVLGVAGISFSFPFFRGSVRIYIDKIPPWSVYRMLHGATFLLNISVMLQSGIKLQDALIMLSNNANPWLKERIDAALYGTGIGGNLGVALYRAGYDFPDKKAVQFLMVLASREGFENAISRFGERWMQMSIKNIQTVAKVMLAFGIISIGMLMVVVVTGADGIQNAIQANMKQ